MARDAGVLNGIYTCQECNGPMVRIGSELRCLLKAEPEELVAAGLIPTKDSTGKLSFDTVARDQQSIQATQALSKGMEIDNAYLEKMGLNLDKIREFQLKYNLVP
jgi:hypothetical protein